MRNVFGPKGVNGDLISLVITDFSCKTKTFLYNIRLDILRRTGSSCYESTHHLCPLDPHLAQDGATRLGIVNRIHVTGIRRMLMRENTSYGENEGIHIQISPSLRPSVLNNLTRTKGREVPGSADYLPFYLRV